jgi:hypothetical protein
VNVTGLSFCGLGAARRATIPVHEGSSCTSGFLRPELGVVQRVGASLRERSFLLIFDVESIRDC